MPRPLGPGSQDMCNIPHSATHQATAKQSHIVGFALEVRVVATRVSRADARLAVPKLAGITQI